MSMAVSLGSRSSFSGASMIERNAQAEIAIRARGSAGKLMRGVCGAANTFLNGPASTSAAQTTEIPPMKSRRLVETMFSYVGPNIRAEAGFKYFVASYLSITVSAVLLVAGLVQGLRRRKRS